MIKDRRDVDLELVNVLSGKLGFSGLPMQQIADWLGKLGTSKYASGLLRTELIYPYFPIRRI